MKKLFGRAVRVFLVVLLLVAWIGERGAAQEPASGGPAVDLWKLAHQKQDVHRFSTLVTAEQVRDYCAAHLRPDNRTTGILLPTKEGK